MREIVLNASNWRTVEDFFEGLFRAVEAPAWHGTNFNALYDSMVIGQINGIERPYRLTFVGAGEVSDDARELIEELSRAARTWFVADDRPVLVDIAASA